MSVSKKLRFDVLSRDNHCCMYCWRKPPYVMLEVDHIIPKKKWWSDVLDNLITSCFDCNRGKWWETRENKSKNLYKTKIKDKVYNVKNYFQEKWNWLFMWTIDKKTYTLLMLYINHHMVDCNVYMTWLDFPPIIPEWWPYWHNELDDMFRMWWEYCDNVLDMMYDYTKDYIDELIEEVFTDENRNWSKEWDYSSKLNYKLTDFLNEIYENDWKLYVLYKFTLHHKIISNG